MRERLFLVQGGVKIFLLQRFKGCVVARLFRAPAHEDIEAVAYRVYDPDHASG